MNRHLLSALLLPAFMGKPLTAQSPARWDIGGIGITIGEPQSATLTNIRAGYAVSYVAEVDRWAVTCREGLGKDNPIGMLKFAGGKLVYAIEFFSYDCNEALMKEKGADWLLRKLQVAHAKLMTYSPSRQCDIDKDEDSEEVLTTISCPNGYSLRVTVNKTKAYLWGITTFVEP